MHLKEVFGQDVIRKRIEEMAKDISSDFQDKPLVTVCVLKGAFIFYADLVRSMSIDPEMDFVRMSSYGDQTSSSGKVIFSKDMEIPIKGKHVLIVEDIVDTGRSVSYLRRVLEARGPQSISVCALIDKHERREVDVKVDYAGFALQRGFIVGYGLDYAEKYRNLPGVFEIVPD
ncbi:hypoxanthine phosphoribosyltransferase [Desulfonatronovibrio hydrogenovorans]|uniref:hypoxanthine phosphoribosyltransferase n=1 Tax=Desulfonatronovibrio hydrogenovorans TaxID=53245 RepID=UPI00048B7855|nr:hypoxanthine phosphoribosyltransferase [Desulfonatronovibrio hydrogenovorans]